MPYVSLLFLISLLLCPSQVLAADLTRGEQDQLTRLKAIGYAEVPKIYIRIFKQEKQLEIWVGDGQDYKLFRSLDICRYSGSLGPKLEEGDKQAPEGFYHIPATEILWNSTKWPKALNLAFPNVFDAALKRTGSHLLIHGGCSSKGCYALGDGAMQELYAMISLAVKKEQAFFPIHIFPFRFTAKNIKKYEGHKWSAFWQTLKPVYEKFNQLRRLPDVLVCEKGYHSPHRAYGQDMVRGACIRPLPINAVAKLEVKPPAWVAKVVAAYPVNSRRVTSRLKSRIKVACNLKRPSCKRWLFLRRKMLKKGTLPKHLLRSVNEQ